ncbi:MAG: hypothetical protein ACI9DK_002497 [Vicingaceae bacterium]|jgi:hypothetical protein
MDAVAKKELTKFSMLAVGISAVVVTAALLAYHHLVIKDEDEAKDEKSKA